MWWRRCRPAPPRGRARAARTAPGRRTSATPRAPRTGRRTAQLRSFPTTHELDLGLELDVEAALHLGADALNQRGHVLGLCAALIDDEVAVQRRDHCRALAQAFQSRGLDEAARRVARRVLEHAAAVLGLDRLRLVTLGRELGHHPFGLFPIPTLEVHGGLDDEGALERSLAQC